MSWCSKISNRQDLEAVIEERNRCLEKIEAFRLRHPHTSRLPLKAVSFLGDMAIMAKLYGASRAEQEIAFEDVPNLLLAGGLDKVEMPSISQGFAIIMAPFGVGNTADFRPYFTTALDDLYGHKK